METTRPPEDIEQQLRRPVSTDGVGTAAAGAVSAHPSLNAPPTGDRIFETLKVHTEGPVLFADIAAPPMNFLGPAMVRDLVSLIQHRLRGGAMEPNYWRYS